MAARSTPHYYTPGPGDTLTAPATAISEFFGFTADCGQAAAEIIYSWAKGEKPSGEHINAVVRAMQEAGLAGPQGTSSLHGNSVELTKEGISNHVTGDWLGALNQYAGVKPIELFVNNAQALPGDEIGVHRHFITVEGITKQGQYIVSDPDNLAAKSGRLVVYGFQDLKNAQTGGAIVPDIAGKGGGGPTVPLPPGAQGIADLLRQLFGGINASDPLGISNALSGLLSALGDKLHTALVDIGLFTLALVLIGLGAILIFWEPITGAAKDTAGAAKDAAVAAA